MNRKGVLFKDLSTSNESRITLNCNLSDPNFKVRKSLYRHLRVNHGVVDRPEDFPVDKPDLLRCKMCKFQIPRSKVMRHLRKVHHFSDLRPGDVLNGWE